MFVRAKDWLDIEQVPAATPDLDLESIESWLRDLAGGDDERATRFAELAARARSNPIPRIRVMRPS